MSAGGDQRSRDSRSVGQRIDAAYPDLTPQERRAADFILAHLGDLAVYSSAELARLSGVSKATVSRLFRRLGFADSKAVRENVLEARSQGAPGGAGRTGSDVTAHLAREIANLTATLEALDVTEPARLIAGARSVLVIGLRNSYPVALHLREQLAQVRQGVLLAPLPGQSLGEELAGLGQDDTVVLVGFRRRPAAFAGLAAAVSASGAHSVLLADPGGRRHASGFDVFLECPLEAGGAFDSYATAMSVVSLLAGGVLSATGRTGPAPAGRERIERISALYAELGELEGP